MTKVVITDDNGKAQITLKGHADFAPEGCEDVVCAGISTLVYAIANYLDGVEKRGAVNSFLFHERAGDMSITFEISDTFSEWPEIKKLIVDGFRTLEDSYPDNISVTEGGAH